MTSTTRARSSISILHTTIKLLCGYNTKQSAKRICTWAIDHKAALHGESALWPMVADERVGQMKAEIRTNKGPLIVGNAGKNTIGLKLFGNSDKEVYLEVDAKEFLEIVKAAYNLTKD